MWSKIGIIPVMGGAFFRRPRSSQDKSTKVQSSSGLRRQLLSSGGVGLSGGVGCDESAASMRMVGVGADMRLRGIVRCAKQHAVEPVKQ